MLHRRRVAAAIALLLGFGAISPSVSPAFVSEAHAQNFIQNLIARLRGETLPAGIVKSNGRIEATQVDVSSKYPGRLAEVTVEEGSPVAQGQVIARVASPEYEAQLRAAEANVQKSKDALSAAEAEIVSRQSALQFAKSDFERGQELMKSGHITKQVFEQRKRNYDSAVAAVTSFTSQRDQAQSAIKSSEAEVERIESIIKDLTLVSPRNGRVQYQLARAGEVVAAGAPIVTILDLSDVYMTIFLPAGDAGRAAIGDEARIILDAVPDYVVPANVSFVAADAQFTPKTVETKDERAKLMFRMKLKIDPQVLQTYYTRVKTGVRGLGFVRTKPDVQWPADLEVKLPKAPAPAASDNAAPQAAAPGAPADDKAPQVAAPAGQASDSKATDTKSPEAK
jgi:HlyD family secretion protein